MAQPRVEIAARIKRVGLVTKIDDTGIPHVVSQLVLECDDLLEEDIKALARLQYKGQLQVGLTATQGELFRGKQPARQEAGDTEA